MIPHWSESHVLQLLASELQIIQNAVHGFISGACDHLQYPRVRAILRVRPIPTMPTSIPIPIPVPIPVPTPPISVPIPIPIPIPIPNPIPRRETSCTS